MEILQNISIAVQTGKAKDIKVLVAEAIEQKIPVKDILELGLLAGMSIIGEKFKNNDVYVPDVLVAARAMKIGTEILKPLLIEGKVQSKGKVVIGTVKGDLHDIGKNLVKMMMEGQGLEVIDLGVDITAETFVQTAKEQGSKIIALSALLTTTMTQMKNVVDLVNKEGLSSEITVMVGGAPVTESFKNSIGADIYTSDAASAAEEAVKVYA